MNYLKFTFYALARKCQTQIAQFHISYFISLLLVCTIQLLLRIQIIDLFYFNPWVFGLILFLLGRKNFNCLQKTTYNYSKHISRVLSLCVRVCVCVCICFIIVPFSSGVFLSSFLYTFIKWRFFHFRYGFAAHTAIVFICSCFILQLFTGFIVVFIVL